MSLKNDLIIQDFVDIPLNDQTQCHKPEQGGAHIIFWTPPRQPVVEGKHVAQHVITDHTGKGPRENYRVQHRFCICTHQLNVDFGDLRLA